MLNTLFFFLPCNFHQYTARYTAPLFPVTSNYFTLSRRSLESTAGVRYVTMPNKPNTHLNKSTARLKKGWGDITDPRYISELSLNYL